MMRNWRLIISVCYGFLAVDDAASKRDQPNKRFRRTRYLLRYHFDLLLFRRRCVGCLAVTCFNASTSVSSTWLNTLTQYLDSIPWPNPKNRKILWIIHPALSAFKKNPMERSLLRQFQCRNWQASAAISPPTTIIINGIKSHKFASCSQCLEFDRLEFNYITI